MMAIAPAVQVWLEGHGIAETWSEAVTGLSVVFILLGICVAANFIAKSVIVRLVHFFLKRTKNTWDDVMIKHRLFRRCSHLVPAFIIYYGIQLAYAQENVMVVWLQKIAFIYMIVVAHGVINAVFSIVHDIYQTLAFSRNKPIKGYIQILRIVTHFLTGIFIISVLLDKSPWGLLSILGGLTAVLLLVFKDTILGFVASIQLVANDMVAVGDWIEMPQYGADGDVIDISINTVKVQNWDKTITTVPTYALISNAFKNWRGMTLSGGRRIKRAVNIDMSSIRFCDETMIRHFSRIAVLQSYLEKKTKEISDYNIENKIDVSVLANGRRLTNIGTFRAYINEYLKRHPMIHQQMTFLVRQLAPTAQGLPLEIYVFSKDQVWANYEAIQADLFDHILAIIPEFGLRVFQQPSGHDLARGLSFLNESD